LSDRHIIRRVLLAALGSLLAVLGVVLCVVPIPVISPLLGLSRIYLGIVMGVAGLGVFFYGLFNKHGTKKVVLAIIELISCC